VVLTFYIIILFLKKSLINYYGFYLTSYILN